MSKQITAKELADIVTRLLTQTEATGELDSFDAYQGFMTDIAQVVCDHCGGEIHHPADPLDDIWYVGVHGNDSLPNPEGGIWAPYDKEGELFAEGSIASFEAKYGPEHPEHPKADWQYEVANGDTVLSYWDWVSHQVESDELYAEVSEKALRDAGVSDYCNQVCGGGNCGGERVCQYGIDTITHMPTEGSH